MNEEFGSKLLKQTARIHFPFILVFGIYVVVHGHYSPGGGFQGGVLLSMAIILLDLIWGPNSPLKISYSKLIKIGALGILFYYAIGAYSFVWGKNFLDYSALSTHYTDHPGEIRALGSFGIELGVTLTVFSTLVLIYKKLQEGPRH
ncbi:MAG: hypothetical protein KDD52_01350 [Bdellovibrionales bacterium]|nr:hypothetical protein [Bdellovibrionales bacterium]